MAEEAMVKTKCPVCGAGLVLECAEEAMEEHRALGKPVNGGGDGNGGEGEEPEVEVSVEGDPASVRKILNKLLPK